MGDKLRFAPVIRVSTERQAQRGESLATQKTQIIQAVERLGGIVPECCWEYSGQEQATPDQERKIINKLLSDARKGIFDAVIVCDASRWSRDNRMSKDGLDILKKNGIRFFVHTTEYNLSRPEHLLFLGMTTEINEFHAQEQARKSILNRIARARRNLPASGNLPFGRTFDKKTGQWGIDTEKQKIIQIAAEKYLNGESIINIAKKFSMNHTTLHKVLTRRSGDKWEQKFRLKNSILRRACLRLFPASYPKRLFRRSLRESNPTAHIHMGR
jgi:site-specific DNA recombinase